MRARLAAPLKRWAIGLAQRRIERELAEYRDPPELRSGFFARRRLGPHGQQQVFRSLIQVNFYPRERGE